uniref:Uncharacterized protein n=1 Tax=Pseudictyota dubia TaxID=2749911 RepID=A0A6U2CZ74_9STRA
MASRKRKPASSKDRRSRIECSRSRTSVRSIPTSHASRVGSVGRTVGIAWRFLFSPRANVGEFYFPPLFLRCPLRADLRVPIVRVSACTRCRHLIASSSSSASSILRKER